MSNSSNPNCYEIDGLVVVAKPPRIQNKSRRNRRNLQSEPVDNIMTQCQDDYDPDMTLPEKKFVTGDFHYEYRDHTADIQIHSWGSTIERSFESIGVGMCGYMFDLDTVHIDETKTETLFFSEIDIFKLLFTYLNEILLKFALEQLIVARIKVHELLFNPSVNESKPWSIRCTIYGEQFDRSRHGLGTEVKAITYSHMVIKCSDSSRLGKHILTYNDLYSDDNRNLDDFDENAKLDDEIVETNMPSVPTVSLAADDDKYNLEVNYEINNSISDALHGSDIYVVVDI